MRRTVLIGQFGALVLIILVPFTVSAQPKAEVAPAPSERVSAIGSASAGIPPDTAILTFGVEIRNPSTTQAALINERVTGKVVSAFEAQGVDPSDISVAPYEMVFVPSTFIPALGTTQKVEFDIQQKGSYKVVTDIRVTVRRLSEMASLINTALDAGVDRIDAVEYSSSKISEIEKGLIPKAIEDARAQATILAANLGLSLMDPLQISVVPNPDSTGESASGEKLRSGAFNLPMLQARVAVRVEYRAKKSN
ncbi:MAG TPA: SIMPL domain-containing protein [Spirochaetia bacterium]|nr:SIMPL domain-containing protein [Spirochaetia bacterium]